MSIKADNLIEVSNLKAGQRVIQVDGKWVAVGVGGKKAGSAQDKIKPLTLTNVDTQQQSIQISLYKVGNPVVDGIQYRLSQTSQWQPYTMYKKIKLSPGAYVQFQNTNQQLSTSVSDYICTLASGYYQASGQMQSMLNYIDTCPDYCFYAFFYNGNSQITNYLTKPPKLSAKEVGQGSYFRMFQYCGSLTQAPQLPATKLGKLCYSYMFSHCNALTNTMTQLPATELQQSCYSHMFQHCVNLAYAMDQLKAYYVPLKAYQNMFYGTAIKKSPKLNSTQMAQRACYAMFMDCKQLEEAGQLPATRLGERAYSYTFSGCSSLTKAPELPGTELAGNCYRLMFQSCTALTQTQVELPAQHIPSYCYDGMYKGCTSITKAPVIKAKTCQALACNSMFQDCTNLSSIQACFTTWDFEGASYTTNWVKGVSATGQFKGSTQLSKTYGVDFIPEGWTYQFNDQNPLTLKALIDGVTISLEVTHSAGSRPDTSKLFYRLDKDTQWQPYTFEQGSNKGLQIQLAKDQYIQIKNVNNVFSYQAAANIHFNITGDTQVSGSLLSLINYNKEYKHGVFNKLFQNTDIVNTPQFPDVQLTTDCYNSMFRNCSKLKSCSNLPSKTLVGRCYQYMFKDSAIQTAPQILATKTDSASCHRMFQGCVDLRYAPSCLYFTAFKPSACDNMFNGCTNLIRAPKITVTQVQKQGLAGFCYNCSSLQEVDITLENAVLDYRAFYVAFSGCSQLTSFNDISVSFAGSNSLAYMFQNCTGLIQTPALDILKLGYACCHKMFIGCSGLTKMPELANTQLDQWCYARMFQDCVNLTQTTTLPAQQLKYNCYRQMFKGCSNLASINVGFYNWSQDLEATTDWLADVSATGLITISTNLNKLIDASHIPQGWSYQYNDQNPLTLTSTSTTCTIFIRKTGQINDIDIEYKLDSQQTWQKLKWWAGSDSHSIALQAGQSVKFRNLTQTLSTSQTNYVHFMITGTAQASGNVMSMLNYSQQCTPFCFFGLFVSQPGLVKAPQLPCMHLAQSCYQRMFQGTNITTMPQLPALELAAQCYTYMFYKCKSLTNVKPLPAPIVQYRSYLQMFSQSAITDAPQIKASAFGVQACSRMFYRCKSLVNGPSYLNAQMLSQSSLNGMLQQCDNLQTCFTRLPAIVVPKKAYYCLFYRCYKFNQTVTIDAFDLRQSSLAYMFYECTSLTNKPIFTVANKLLGDYCYSNTFVGCSALTETPDIRGTVNGASDACYFRAFKNCTALTSVFDTITIPEAADWCCQQMFMGCTSLQNTPKIIINKLDSQCCFNMFNGCSNLNSISVQFTDWTVNGVQCFKDWVANIASAGVFTCKGQLPVQFGASRIPWGWTVVNSETNQMIVQPEWYQDKQPVDMNGDGTINRDDFPQPQQPEVEQPAPSSSSYTVTGAGTDEVNGTYTDSGQKMPNSEDIMYSNGSCYLCYMTTSGMSIFRKKPLSDGIAYYIAQGDFRSGAVQWSTNHGQEPLPSIMQI